MHPSSESALKEIRRRAANKKQIVFVSGNFNIIHPGHLRLFKFAAECGDYLVVGVNAGGTHSALLPADLRLEAVKSISLLNHAFLLQDSVVDFIRELRPAIVVKGKEYENQVNQEKEGVASYGGKLLFSSGEVRFSSLDLLRKEFHETNFSAIKKPLEFPQRHGFKLSDLDGILSKFENLRVTVVGDLIVDEYITCEPLGMSQEDPSIVVSPLATERFVGGASIVAAHAAGLGAKVDYFSVSGNDSIAEYAKSRLNEYGVKTHLFIDESRPTTLKQRFRANGKTMLRVSHLRQHPITADLMREMIPEIKKSLSESNLLVFSDFNYGCIPQPMVEELAAYCAERGIAMVADSQSSSQVGDVSRFPGMMLLTPTEREARLAMRDFDSGLVVLAEGLTRKAHAKNILISLGAEGVLIHAADSKSGKWLTDQLPALNTAPKDGAGAGDSLLICTSMALALGEDIWRATYLGSLAAACQVGRLGNIPLTRQDIVAELEL